MGPKELPELFVVDSEDEFEDDQEISEESILRNKLLNENIGQLTRHEQSLQNGNQIVSEDDENSQLPRSGDQMKLGTFMNKVLSENNITEDENVSSDSDGENVNDNEEDESDSKESDEVAQIILQNTKQAVGTSFLHRKKIHPWLLENYIEPLPTLDLELQSIWKPIALYGDEEGSQYVMIQVIRKQAKGYEVITNRIINAYQLNGVHVYKPLGRTLFTKFKYSNLRIPEELLERNVAKIVQYFGKRLQHVQDLQTPDEVSKEQPLGVFK